LQGRGTLSLPTETMNAVSLLEKHYCLHFPEFPNNCKQYNRDTKRIDQ
jgi:hypothetical protein